MNSGKKECEYTFDIRVNSTHFNEITKKKNNNNRDRYEDRRVTKDNILFLFLYIYINKRFTDRALALYWKENKRNTCLLVFTFYF
jgi:hypothetical protein